MKVIEFLETRTHVGVYWAKLTAAQHDLARPFNGVYCSIQSNAVYVTSFLVTAEMLNTFHSQRLVAPIFCLTMICIMTLLEGERYRINFVTQFHMLALINVPVILILQLYVRWTRLRRSWPLAQRRPALMLYMRATLWTLYTWLSLALVHVVPVGLLIDRTCTTEHQCLLLLDIRFHGYLIWWRQDVSVIKIQVFICMLILATNSVPLVSFLVFGTQRVRFYCFSWYINSLVIDDLLYAGCFRGVADLQTGVFTNVYRDTTFCCHHRESDILNVAVRVSNAPRDSITNHTVAFISQMFDIDMRKH